jgi:hypothetical protein
MQSSEHVLFPKTKIAARMFCFASLRAADADRERCGRFQMHSVQDTGEFLEIAVASNATVGQVEDLFHSTICPVISRPTYFTLEVCRGIIQMYAPTAWPIILSGVVQPDVLCRLVNVCADTDNELDALRNDLRRLRNTLAPRRATHKRAVRPPVVRRAGNGKALRISARVRFARRHDVSSLVVIATVIRRSAAARWSAPMQPTPPLSVGRVLVRFDADNVLGVAERRVANLQPPVDAVVVTGDLTPHDIWNETAALQLARINAVNSALVSTFKGIAPVFMVLGNHDTVACDLFSTHAKDWLHHDDFRWLLDDIGSSWTLPPSALATLRQGGYYAAPIVPGLKLLAINTNGWNGNNVYVWLSDTKMTQMVQWFAQELASSEASGEKVDCCRSHSAAHRRHRSARLGDQRHVEAADSLQSHHCWADVWPHASRRVSAGAPGQLVVSRAGGRRAVCRAESHDLHKHQPIVSCVRVGPEHV